MPPKKAPPRPASDESDSDMDEPTIRKTTKKMKKVQIAEDEEPKTAQDALDKAHTAVMDGEESGPDDELDLFAMELPPRPEFLTKPNNSDRLMIMNVEVENFKSYHGKAQIGPFHKSFTSIIGPNGSGKSNLIDALLFVFGFRASKIRSAKVANLIHKSRGRDPDSCTVTIFFQRIVDMPNLQYEVVPDSKFTISRTAYRNSSSGYAIDFKPASKAEVEAKLRSVDIDIEHNRFLILQGEVEQIAMMKAVKTNKNETGMVEYLEDIIGSNRLEKFVKMFQYRTNRLLCQQSQQRITRDHAKNTKDKMEGDVRTAVEFLVKENETVDLRMRIDQRKRLRYLDKAAPLAEDLEAKKAERKALLEQLEANNAEYKTMDELDKRLADQKKVLDKETDKLSRAVADLTAEETRRKATMKRYAGDVEKTEAELEKELKKKTTLEGVPEKARKKLEKWKEEIETLAETESRENAEADANIAKFAEETKELKEEKEKAAEEWAVKNAAFNKIKKEHSVASSDYEDTKKAAYAGPAKLEKMEEKLKAQEEKYAKETAEMESLMPEHDQVEDELKRLDAEQPKLKAELSKKTTAVAQARERHEEIQNANIAVSEDKITQMLFKEKEKGNIPSFIGKLGDLGVIDQKYDAAFSNNYMGSMSKLLIRNSNDGPWIIDFLRKNKLQRTSLQAVDRLLQVSRFGPQNYNPQPEGTYPVPRLIDLIECDDEVRPVFYDVVRDTLCAENTKQAIELAKQYQTTVVTMTGTIVFKNGAITGGGKQQTGAINMDRSKKSKQVTEADRQEERDALKRFEQLKAEEAVMREQWYADDKKHSALRNRFGILKKQMTTLDTSLKVTTVALKTLKTTVAALRTEVAAVKIDEKELEEKEKLVEQLTKKRDKLGAEAQAAEDVQKELQEKMDAQYHEMVDCHRKAAKEASQRKQKLEKDSAKEKANVDSSARNIKKCDDSIARLEREAEKKRQLIVELEEQAPDEAFVAEKKAALKEREEKMKELDKEFKEMSDKRSALTNQETQLEQRIKEAKEAVRAAKERIGDYAEKAKSIEKRLESLKKNRVPRFRFMTNAARPEDMDAVYDEEMPNVDENLSPEEVAKQKRHIVMTMTDQAYAMEFEMRQRGLEELEDVSEMEGERLVAVTLLSEEEVRELTDRNVDEMQFKLKAAEEQLETLKKKVDLSAIDTYIRKVKHFNAEASKMAQVTADYTRHKNELQRIKKMRLEEFQSAFEFIGEHLVAVYKMLTDGGDAKLEYIDKDDPFTLGISFMVRPAKKAWKQIQYLSGGEKTLSSLALIFALHMFRPTPFYVMDEIDAALDYRNVSIIAQYVRQKTENAQFIIISLRNNMFELANRLVGIYKVDGCTQNVAIDPLAVCQTAKTISDSLGQATCTLPNEVTARFNETVARQNKELTAQEKQYPNFPSTSEISKAEKIVSVEGRVRKQLNDTARPLTITGHFEPPSTSTRAPSRATTNTTERPDSRAVMHKRVPAPRLVARASSTNSVAAASGSAAPKSSEAATSSSEAVANTTTSKTPGRPSRKQRDITSDDTTPPTKRANSSTTTTRARRRKNTEEREKEEEEEDDD